MRFRVANATARIQAVSYDSHTLKKGLGSDLEDPMTRPLSQSELSLMTAQIGQQAQPSSFTRFLINSVVLGAWIGIGMAALVLLTNTCGILTLILAQADPIAPAVAFVVAGIMIFVPVTVAGAVGWQGAK
jgi:hypothetical protein